MTSVVMWECRVITLFCDLEGLKYFVSILTGTQAEQESHIGRYVNAPLRLKPTRTRSEYIDELILLLLKVHDDYNRYFPGKEASVLAKKAYDFYRFYPDKYYEAYNMFNIALNLDPGAVQTAYLNKYFNAVIKLYKVDSLDTEGLLNGYSMVGE